METILITISAFLASLFTFFSGFGLATILMPIIAIFFPLPIAIIVTAIVHLLHNLLKTLLLWKAIDWQIVFRFGMAAGIATIPGALLLKWLSQLGALYQYSFYFIKGEFSILHLSIGLLLIILATLELFPNKNFHINNLLIGGAITGFFGGLSGNQGAFRSLFLVQSIEDTKAFIGTNAIIALLVDIVRLIIYVFSFGHLIEKIKGSLLAAGIIGALVGIFFGMLLIGKVRISFIKKMIVGLLYLLGFLLAIGII